ncbi:MAG: ABC transporter ATP-binding protein [Alphaproteobacteria bacterium]|nr:ABC transporter ATP-binding protein [Alphaproteobacteria bacterium]
MAVLEILGLRKHYALGAHAVRALDGVSLSLAAGSLTAMVGRSGCGKTTLLRLIAGLDEPSGGHIRRRGARDGDTARRPVGMVFQEPRLMPWLTVAENVRLALHAERDEDAVRAVIDDALALVGLTAFRDARPEQLSGGMAQRAAVARALAIGADVILMDEPFGALDAFTRRTLQRELVRIWLAKRPTILFVTHDVEEAAILAERVLVMEHGRIVDDLAVDRPHPRDPVDPQLLRLRERILARVTGESVPA